MLEGDEINFSVSEKTGVNSLVVSGPAEPDAAIVDDSIVGRVERGLNAHYKRPAVVEVYERVEDATRKIISGNFILLRSSEADVFHWFEVSSRLRGRGDLPLEVDDADIMALQYYVDNLNAAVNGRLGTTLGYQVGVRN